MFDKTQAQMSWEKTWEETLDTAGNKFALNIISLEAYQK